MARYGYARISTRSQRDDSQLDALRAAGCERNWTDTASGKLARRPEWDNCLDHLRAGDELVVTRLSRMARSVRHLTGIAALLAERGIDLVVLKQGIDTTTPAGRFTFHVLAAMDEMLADLISEGTREGLESAQARGRVGGRKPKLTDLTTSPTSLRHPPISQRNSAGGTIQPGWTVEVWASADGAMGERGVDEGPQAFRQLALTELGRARSSSFGDGDLVEEAIRAGRRRTPAEGQGPEEPFHVAGDAGLLGDVRLAAQDDPGDPAPADHLDVHPGPYSRTLTASHPA